LTVALRGQGLGNFVTVMTEPLLGRFFFNSAIITLGSIAVVLVAATLAAYAFVVLPIRWSGAILLFIVAPMMIPPASIFLPLFINVRALGLLNTLPSVIGPIAALTIPVMLLLIRSYLMGVPRALIDASRMDGCNSWQTLTLVLLPMMRPVFVVVTVWTFLAAWNEYFLPLVFLRKVESQVVSMAPKYFVIDEMTPNLGLQFAALLLISVPTLILFLIFRRHLMEPVTSGAVK
jgi:ABC-type glycerol-3-phosphate transport system permease component